MTPIQQLTPVVRILCALAIMLVGVGFAGCSKFVKPELPGETDYAISEVSFPGELTVDVTPLFPLLSVRAAGGLIPGMPYNPYRKAEDARRIKVFWQSQGYFDAAVKDSEVTFDDEKKEARVVWHVSEGPEYRIRRVDFVGMPADADKLVREHLVFGPGDPVQMERYRRQRNLMADALRESGWAHAEVFSRTFVDRAAKAVDWVYFVDTGPKTFVGKVEVSGNVAIPRDVILDRLGIAEGQPIDYARMRKVELDLIDTGAFNTARLVTTADNQLVMGLTPPDTALPPDTGGTIKSQRIDANGDLVPRTLSKSIDVTAVVVESPSVQANFGLGAYIDLERVDPFAGFELQLRNALGPLHHIVVRGEVGYGIGFTDDDDNPEGLYGSALLRYLKPGLFGRLGDFRTTLKFEQKLFPDFHWRTATGGMGVRTHIARGVFFDFGPRFKIDWPVEVGDVAAADLERLDLAAVERTMNAEVLASLIWDGRDDGFEPMNGHLLALRAAWAPGGALGDNAYLATEADLRFILGLSQHTALGFKAAGGWVFDLGDDGVPLGARLFGGGAFGSRGFYENRLASYAVACDGAQCRNLPVGGSSLFEGSVEFRWLPFRKQFGVVGFVDVGAAGDAANPFEDGVSIAPGLGLRVRTWHIPLAVDFSYRVTDVGRYDGQDRFYVFARIGESF